MSYDKLIGALKHLPGQHNQADHAGKGVRQGGAAGRGKRLHRNAKVSNGVPFGLKSYELSDQLHKAGWSHVMPMPFGNDVAESVGFHMEIGRDTKGWATVNSVHGKTKFSIQYRGSIPNFDRVVKDFKKHFNYTPDTSNGPIGKAVDSRRWHGIK